MTVGTAAREETTPSFQWATRAKKKTNESALLLLLLLSFEASRFLRAFWWSFATVTTVGYGDLSLEVRRHRDIATWHSDATRLDRASDALKWNHHTLRWLRRSLAYRRSFVRTTIRRRECACVCVCVRVRVGWFVRATRRGTNPLSPLFLGTARAHDTPVSAAAATV